ncbi:helix-turn-helix domain-containing protein [Marinoscillum furvescens]|uniref:DNA-binding XRE family transcriptional regulator n=1 Tax=Marinoscillum furvescens DSM 4134 TaxID=1122208 RepID=A0A3D9L5X9_MARFU|nr:helix-turn-helix transcriptional regulator [Marinoscillum furvescens]REE01096.1 DNA-binding XRE family transcriptional regulator [Marinoscillum furvescens DSM 4134]
MTPEQEFIAIVGKQLYTLRKYRQLTQDEVAEKCGVSRKYVSQLERGEVNASLGIVFKLCTALQCYADLTFTPVESQKKPD